MSIHDQFLQSIAKMEQTLADTLNNASNHMNSPDLQRLLKLIIKKEIILELLLEEVVGPQEECPCKFRLGIAGNTAEASVIVIRNGMQETLEGTINFSAEQCFTGGPNCNPAVDNFTILFGNSGNTINFTQGRRGTISCENNTVASLQNGTAQASGNVLTGNFSVTFSYSIDPISEIATVEILATAENGDKFQTTFTAPVSPQTFIGECNETVGASFMK